MNLRLEKIDSSEQVFARCAKAGIACVIVVGLLLIAAGTQTDVGLVGAATAAAPADDGYRQGYFPAQFPPPQGEPEPHIEAF